MKLTKTSLISFAILVLGWSFTLYVFAYALIRYSEKHPAIEKPGYSEIRAIAEQNNLTPRQVAAAVRAPKDIPLHLPMIIASQAISMGFTLGLFALVRALVSRYTGRK